ncbi:hypothetical protein [Stieleria varia]|uniref:Uncharacterized protein n=1 Tax=Stieleria varia TaxID=2528005 RepID=A0A5C6B9L1_9BACT|nr:hypothetical protein [Stieleria varia]TWU08407.1 hypothetical protein Pla52n_09900 [Stieleria varia]
MLKKQTLKIEFLEGPLDGLELYDHDEGLPRYAFSRTAKEAGPAKPTFFLGLIRMLLRQETIRCDVVALYELQSGCRGNIYRYVRSMLESDAPLRGSVELIPCTPNWTETDQ